MPEPPYYAVIFSSRVASDAIDYDKTAARMIELAELQDGFLGIESTRGDDGLGITVSYWRDEAAIAAWRKNMEHRRAQQRGNAEWYDSYELRIARVERAYTGPRR